MLSYFCHLSSPFNPSNSSASAVLSTVSTLHIIFTLKRQQLLMHYSFSTFLLSYSIFVVVLAEALGPFANFWVLLSQQLEIKNRRNQHSGSLGNTASSAYVFQDLVHLPPPRLSFALPRPGVNTLDLLSLEAQPPSTPYLPHSSPSGSALDFGDPSCIDIDDTPSRAPRVKKTPDVQPNDHTSTDIEPGGSGPPAQDPPKDRPYRTGTESLQVDMLNSLINGYISTIQLGAYPDLIATSDQIRFTFGDFSTHGPTSMYNSCIDGIQYACPRESNSCKQYVALIESKVASRAMPIKPWNDIDQVRRQETAEQASYAYENREILLERALTSSASKTTVQSQLLFSISQNKFYLTITEMPLGWIQYIGDGENPICPSSSEVKLTTDDIKENNMLGIWEYGPADICKTHPQPPLGLFTATSSTTWSSKQQSHIAQFFFSDPTIQNALHTLSSSSGLSPSSNQPINDRNQMPDFTNTTTTTTNNNKESNLHLELMIPHTLLQQPGFGSLPSTQSNFYGESIHDILMDKIRDTLAEFWRKIAEMKMKMQTRKQGLGLRLGYKQVGGGHIVKREGEDESSGGYGYGRGYEDHHLPAEPPQAKGGGKTRSAVNLEQIDNGNRNKASSMNSNSNPNIGPRLHTIPDSGAHLGLPSNRSRSGTPSSQVLYDQIVASALRSNSRHYQQQQLQQQQQLSKYTNDDAEASGGAIGRAVGRDRGQALNVKFAKVGDGGGNDDMEDKKGGVGNGGLRGGAAYHLGSSSAADFGHAVGFAPADCGHGEEVSPQIDWKGKGRETLQDVKNREQKKHRKREEAVRWGMAALMSTMGSEGRGVESSELVLASNTNPSLNPKFSSWVNSDLISTSNINQNVKHNFMQGSIGSHLNQKAKQDQDPNTSLSGGAQLDPDTDANYLYTKYTRTLAREQDLDRQVRDLTGLLGKLVLAGGREEENKEEEL
ncbi:hypothetical protein IFR05_000509 [Cadophora sp. M221]|nr:hypothetical protein IFR05_000509 [Cadophora sp. M221]